MERRKVEYKIPDWGSPLGKVLDLQVDSVEDFAAFLTNTLDGNREHAYRVRLQNIGGRWVFRAPDPWTPKGVVGFVSKNPDYDKVRLHELLGGKVRIVEG